MNVKPEIEDAEIERRSHGFPVVGVGASAGGLEAFQSLIASMTPTSGLALVLVQHLDPNHESLLNELLARRSKVPVVTIEDNMEIEEGSIYLIPPGSSLSVEGYKMRLSSFDEPRGLRRPIDKFFESLAREHGSNSAAVVLSGTGSDGSVGVRAMKQAGALVLVQEPKQSKYDGMPRSAIATGAPDLVVPAEDVVGVAAEFFNRKSGIEPKIESDDELIARVSKHVLYSTGYDFSHYKPATLLRRIARRMSVLFITTPTEYLQRLISDQTEAEKLFSDMLINVTYFFRDRDAFESVQTNVIPQILESKGNGDDVRVWVAGCSTGQEPYSLAMLFAEEALRLDVSPTINVFATDIDPDALRRAREGRYPNSIVDEVPPELLERYFKKNSDGYEVGSELRKMIRFSRHSFIKDPPFSRLDMISCRNTIIYFDRWLQKRIMPIFHYAIKPGGFLFLGPSEHLGTGDEGFREIDGPSRVFQRLDGLPRPLALPLPSAQTLQTHLHDRKPTAAVEEVRIESRYEQIVLERHAPASAVIDQKRNVIHSSGRIGRFLELKPGAPRLNIADLAKDPLRDPVRRLLTAGVSEETTSRYLDWSGEVDSEPLSLILTLERIDEDASLVVFQDRIEPRRSESNVLVNTGGGTEVDYGYVQSLEDELEIARQTVRTTVEELETSNEELKSSNEEMMAMNEELQSANEELSTVNDELQQKVRELDEAYGDLRNFVESTNIAAIFLDEDMRLRSFTPAVETYFRVSETDHGRPLDDIKSNISTTPLLETCRAVAEADEKQSIELETVEGDTILQISILPYGTIAQERQGIVIILLPITELRRHARQLEVLEAEATERLAEIETIYRLSPQAMGLMAPDMTYLRVNERMAEINGTSIEGHIGKTILEIVPDLSAQVLEPVRDVFRSGEPIISMKVEGQTKARPDSVRNWEVSWYPVTREDEVIAVGVNVTDVTKYLEMETELRRMMQELQHRVKNMLANVVALVGRAKNERGEPEVVFQTLVKRIKALSHTHNVLTDQNWRGADLRSIIEPELLGVYGEDRITLRGPDVVLNAKSTVALGMTFHEMATNAAKYGALSNQAGSLTVSWAKLDEGDGDILVLRWVEENGPAAEEPSSTGFGTQLIDSTIRGSLRGSIEKTYGVGGYSAEIRLPMDGITRAYDEDEFA